MCKACETLFESGCALLRCWLPVDCIPAFENCGIGYIRMHIYVHDKDEKYFKAIFDGGVGEINHQLEWLVAVGVQNDRDQTDNQWVFHTLVLLRPMIERKVRKWEQ